MTTASKIVAELRGTSGVSGAVRAVLTSGALICGGRREGSEHLRERQSVDGRPHKHRDRPAESDVTSVSPVSVTSGYIKRVWTPT